MSTDICPIYLILHCMYKFDLKTFLNIADLYFYLSLRGKPYCFFMQGGHSVPYSNFFVRLLHIVPTV
jgi:hypothetical protein